MDESGLKDTVKGKYGQAALRVHSGIDADAIAPQVDGKFFSAFVRASKPVQ